MIPIVNGLEAEFTEQIPIHRLDAIDPENLQLMQTYGVRGHPTFFSLMTKGTLCKFFLVRKAKLFYDKKYVIYYPSWSFGVCYEKIPITAYIICNAHASTGRLWFIYPPRKNRVKCNS